MYPSNRRSASVPRSGGKPLSPAPIVQARRALDEILDSAGDLVAGSPHGIGLLTSWILQFPVEERAAHLRALGVVQADEEHARHQAP